MQEIFPGWLVDAHHQGDWLYLILDTTCEELAHTPINLAELMDNVVRRSFFTRVIIDLESILYLPAKLLRQFILLKDKLEERGGQLALCAMNVKAYQSVRAIGLEHAFPYYEGIGAVTEVFRPVQPR